MFSVLKLADGEGKTPDTMMQRLEYSFYMQELNTFISKFGDAYPAETEQKPKSEREKKEDFWNGN